MTAATPFENFGAAVCRDQHRVEKLRRLLERFTFDGSECFGVIAAELHGLELERAASTIVEPSVWKKYHALRGSDKEAGRQRALQLFPTAHALLARRKDHGRAEAALIALAGWHQLHRIVAPPWARAEPISARAETAPAVAGKTQESNQS
jgi:hypothetical protein